MNRGNHLLVGLALLSLAACNQLGQCEQQALGDGLLVTVYNPDGIGNMLIGGKHDYGDACRVFPHGIFTPVDGMEGLYRYALPPGLRILTGG